LIVYRSPGVNEEERCKSLLLLRRTVLLTDVQHAQVRVQKNNLVVKVVNSKK